MIKQTVLFAGLDANNYDALWETDGTVAGTHELTGIDGEYFAGLRPVDLTPFNGEVLFAGLDATPTYGLWATDGTAAGTYELTGISGANPNGLFTSLVSSVGPDLTVFNGRVLFAGDDTAGNGGLWVTDGTAAGTHELMGGSNPYDMTVFNGEVLLELGNATTPPNLWVTDGTAGGTHELNVSGANVGLFQDDVIPDMTVFNGQVLFSGNDTSGNIGLWVSDGTAAGTHELTGIGGVPPGGIFQPHGFSRPANPDMTILNGMVLFAGSTSGDRGLWVTDGTAAGTHELTGITGASGGGVFEGAFNPDMTALNGEVLFDGEDAAGNSSLWVSDGTAGGTHEITGISGASESGLFSSVGGGGSLFPGFTILKGEALFEGRDIAGNVGVWVTDGTAAGTHELNVGGASANGLQPSLYSNELAPFGLISANLNAVPVLIDVSANASFTEEGPATTVSPSVSVSDAQSTTLASATVQITGGTFTGGGDVLVANTASTSITASYNSTTETLTLTGSDTLAHYSQALDTVTFAAGENPTDFGSNPNRTVTWTLNDGSASSAAATTTVSITNVNDPPTLANVVASVETAPAQPTVTLSPSVMIADPDNLMLAGATIQISGGTFVGDGDVLAATTTGTSITASYNSTTETLTLTGTNTLANYQQVLDTVTFTAGSNPTNFGADQTRALTWVLNDGSASNNLSTPVSETISFQQSVPFDFDRNGMTDLLFQFEQGTNPNNGTPGIWLMNGATPIAMAGLPDPGPSWRIVGTGDFNGDGKADIVWQDTAGNAGIWLMNGMTPIGMTGFPSPGASWHIVGTGDFNGDGRSDLLWQGSDGTLGVWLMNGTTPQAEAGIGNPGPNTNVVGVADYLGNGDDDILLQNKLTGNLTFDLMNGTSIASSLSINIGDPTWHAVSTGTFNGMTEIAWQSSDGTPAIWLMNGTSPVAEAALPNPGLGWQLVSIDHFNQNGQAGLLFQNTNGALMLWQMNGTSIAAQVNLANPGPGWQSVNGHPFASG
jgi:ELWxxDGT repeat protein